MMKEAPIFIPSVDATLFGILTEPWGESNGTVVLILWGGDTIGSFGKNQIKAKLSRRLAGLGYHSLRIDYPGAGDSVGKPVTYDLNHSFREHVIAAVDWLRCHGFPNVLLLGHCFGARLALSSLGLIQDPVGLVLIAPPVRDYSNPALPRLSKRAPGTEGEDSNGAAIHNFLSPLACALERGLPVLILYGPDDPWYPDFSMALRGDLGKLVERAEGQAAVRVLHSYRHGFPSITAQDDLIYACIDWVKGIDAAPQSRGKHFDELDSPER